MIRGKTATGEEVDLSFSKPVQAMFLYRACRRVMKNPTSEFTPATNIFCFKSMRKCLRKNNSKDSVRGSIK